MDIDSPADLTFLHSMGYRQPGAVDIPLVEREQPPEDLDDTGSRGRPSADRKRSASLVVGVFSASLAFFLWGITVPSPWVDEAATWQAVRRSWPQLLHLYSGADAPLVPYYALLKVWTVFGYGFGVLRTLSALAAAGAVALLAFWVFRRGGMSLALIAAAMLVGMSGFARYAQEPRPYAILQLLSCLAWLVWDRWRRLRTPAAGVLLAGVVALLGLTQLFGLLLLPALVLADLTAGDRSGRSRWRDALTTSLWGALGVLVISVPVAVAIKNGSGPSVVYAVTPVTILSTAKSAFTVGVPGGMVLVVVLALAGVGAMMVRRPRPRGARGKCCAA